LVEQGRLARSGEGSKLLIRRRVHLSDGTRQNPVVGAANLDLRELSSNDLDDMLDSLIGDVSARAVIEGTGWPVLTRSLQMGSTRHPVSGGLGMRKL
jgi:hypothetical protein